MDCLNTVIKLSDNLKIDQFFDFSEIKELVNSKEYLDELINTSQMNFQKMNDYLQKQVGGKVSVAILFGSWDEGLYISFKINKSLQSEILEESIGEQKLAIETIDELINLYPSDRYFQDFRKYFDAEVENLFIEGEMIESEDKNGELVLKIL